MIVQLKYAVILALTISVASLSMSIWILSNSLSENIVPSGVEEREIVKGNVKKVTLDSKDYYFSLDYFLDISDVIQLKVETTSGYQIGNLYFKKASSFYDLNVTLIERLPNSVIVWIEKIDS